VPLTENQYAALVSFEFNVGKLSESTLLKLLNFGDKEGAANQFVRWNKGHVEGKLVPLAGLTRRRTAESALFRS
jgi:lysozyme